MQYDDVLRLILPLGIAAPILASTIVGLGIVGSATKPSERIVSRTLELGLAISAVLSVLAAAIVSGALGAGVSGEVEYGAWLKLGSYEIPAVLLVDGKGIAFAVLSACLTLLVARFSRTYLHKEPGFNRFFVLLGWFATGAQLVALAGALDLFFAGWELIGISSALFIGFFHERDEPVRSSVRAFATYRLCDAGFLMAMVITHEVLGSTRLSGMNGAASLPLWESTAVGLLFLLAAMGKSAQLPFSGWLPRAMEGPTPSSALFYGGLSIHAGLYLMLRVWPMIDASVIVQGVGVVIGLSTAIYAAAVSRTNTDAKGSLAHATLAQVGLILAEISMGWTTLALVHLGGHAMLRVWQYLRAPNVLHDAHRIGHADSSPIDGVTATVAERRAYAAALHRLRLDDRIDAAIQPVLVIARWLDRSDRAWRARIAPDRGEEA